MSHETPKRSLPHGIKNGTLTPVVDHDTAVLKYLEKSEFSPTNIIDQSVANKLEQHLRFRQDSLYDLIRPGELDLVVLDLPARFFKDDVISKSEQPDAAGDPSTGDDKRTLKDERFWTVPDAKRTVDNLKRKPSMKRSRPKSHPSGYELVQHQADPRKITNPQIKPYYNALDAARHELANGDSTAVSSMLTGEESALQFSYMNEMQETIYKIRFHKSLLLPELDERDGSGGQGNDPDEAQGGDGSGSGGANAEKSPQNPADTLASTQ